MTPPGIQASSAPPRPQIQAGTCRVCGCTNEEACIVETFEDLDRPNLHHPLATCSWIEPDLCSRCHGPRRPTRAQAGELQRIRIAKGAIAVRRGHELGQLVIDLVAQPQPVILTMAASGRVVATYAPRRESEAA